MVLNDGSLGCLPDPWGSTNFYPPTFFPGLDLLFLPHEKLARLTFLRNQQILEVNPILVAQFLLMLKRVMEHCER